jgi:hypothetical protein
MKRWIVVTFFLFACVLVLVAIVLSWTGKIALFGLTKSFYYLVLVMLGLCAAGFLFGALRSYAHYSGRVLNGTLELGGPAVILFLIIIVGLIMAPPSEKFDLVVHVHGPGGAAQMITNGSLIADFGVDWRRVEINSDGQAHFNGLPASDAAVKVILIPEVKGYSIKDQSAQQIPPNHVLYLELVPTLYSSIIHGRLQYSSGVPVAHAQLSIDDGLVNGVTNDQGEFRFSVPFENGHVIHLTASVNGKIGYDNDVAVPIGTTLTFKGVKQ